MDFRDLLKNSQCGVYEAKDDLLDFYPLFFLTARFKTFVHSTNLYDIQTTKSTPHSPQKSKIRSK